MLAIVCSFVDKIRIPNLSNQTQVLKHNGHFCQVNLVFSPPDGDQQPMNPLASTRQHPTPQEHTHSCAVTLDPENCLLFDVSVKFCANINKFDNVFNPKLEGSNGAPDPFEVTVNMGEIVKAYIRANIRNLLIVYGTSASKISNFVRSCCIMLSR